KNFKRETSLPGSSASTHLIERFTRADANTLLYEFTVNDPTTWTRPWTAVVPMARSEDPIYEYACHEGNYAFGSILAGARADAKPRTATPKKGSQYARSPAARRAPLPPHAPGSTFELGALWPRHRRRGCSLMHDLVVPWSVDLQEADQPAFEAR